MKQKGRQVAVLFLFIFVQGCTFSEKSDKMWLGLNFIGKTKEETTKWHSIKFENQTIISYMI